MADLLTVDDTRLGRIRFGRNRFLAGAAGALFGTVAGMSRSSDAFGACGPSEPCFGFGLCCCCSGPVCCQSNCVRMYGECWWTENRTCWNTCNGAGVLFQCCDWISNNPCICRAIVGSC
jgi:hypothetical protein